jgi:hypothetical protein
MQAEESDSIRFDSTQRNATQQASEREKKTLKKQQKQQQLTMV